MGSGRSLKSHVVILAFLDEHTLLKEGEYAGLCPYIALLYSTACFPPLTVLPVSKSSICK